MANSLEYVLSLNDQMSTKLRQIGVNSTNALNTYCDSTTNLKKKNPSADEKANHNVPTKKNLFTTIAILPQI
jgi:hypothetical protein